MLTNYRSSRKNAIIYLKVVWYLMNILTGRRVELKMSLHQVSHDTAALYHFDDCDKGASAVVVLLGEQVDLVASPKDPINQ